MFVHCPSSEVIETNKQHHLSHFLVFLFLFCLFLVPHLRLQFIRFETLCNQSVFGHEHLQLLVQHRSACAQHLLWGRPGWRLVPFLRLARALRGARVATNLTSVIVCSCVVSSVDMVSILWNCISIRQIIAKKNHQALVVKTTKI